MKQAREILKDVKYFESSYAAIEGADLLLLLTEWNEFRYLDLLKVKQLLKQPIFVDLRNVYEPEKMKKFGFKYVSLGRT